MIRSRALLGTVAICAVAPMAVPANAGATFHLVLVREVYPGSVAAPQAEYVELQAYASGQSHVDGHSIVLYGPSGAKVGSAEFTSDAAGTSNQMTLLAATPAAESQLGVVADAGLPADALDPAGGAVCWEALDCVSWGAFAGSTPSASGSPADPLGIPDGMALRRTIAPGCPTLLEEADDSNDSATDFADVFPAPRPSSVAPSEHACGGKAAGDGGGGPGLAAGAAGRPRTRLRGHPGRRTGDRTPTFRFDADRPGVTFLCRLDRARYKRCHSPFVTGGLPRGRHVFMVKARAPGGATDRTPAVWHFRVI